jgi:uncharacterized protein YacL (UPF0231 family)
MSSYNIITRSCASVISDNSLLSGLQRRLANMGENITLELDETSSVTGATRFSQRISSRRQKESAMETASTDSTRRSPRLSNKPRVDYSIYLDEDELSNEQNNMSFKKTDAKQSNIETLPVKTRVSKRLASKPRIDYSIWIEQEEEEFPYFNPKMKSQPTYEVNIDFDGASKAWMANKKRVGMGMYEYKKTRSTGRA